MSGADGLPLRTRIRRFLGAAPAFVVVALLVLALAGGYATYTVHAADATTTETRDVPVWSATGAFGHSATVDGATELYPNGTVLESRPYYYTRVSPTLDGSLTFTYEASDGAVDVVARPTLVVRSVGETPETVFWETTESLSPTRASAVEPGESVTVPFSVDVAAVANRTERIHEQLGTANGQVESLVVVDVQATGSAGDRDVDEDLAYILPISVGGGGYAVEAPDPATETFSRTVTVRSLREYGLAETVAGPALLGLAALGGVGYAAGRRRGLFEVTPEDASVAAFRRQRATYDEWVATVRLPTSATKLPAATAADFESLVDVAISTGNVVLEDPTDGRFHVVNEGVRYTYTPPVTARERVTTVYGVPTETPSRQGQGQGHGRDAGSTGEVAAGGRSDDD